MASHPPTLASPAAARQEYAIAARRPASWRQILPGHRLPVVSKTALLIALGVYLSGGTFQGATVGVTMLLGALLWFDLYILNEATDLTCEEKMQVPRPVMALLFVIPFGLCIAAYCVFPSLALPFGLMVASQFAYCVPPLRLKRHWWAIILLSGTLNPVLRLQCGVELGVHGLTPLVYAAFISLHIGAALRARVLLRERDCKFGYRPVPAGAETAGKWFTLLGFLGAAELCRVGAFPPAFIPLFLAAAAFSVYAWSGRKNDLGRLRRGWLWFALLSFFALAALFAHR